MSSEQKFLLWVIGLFMLYMVVMGILGVVIGLS